VRYHITTTKSLITCRSFY